MRWNVGMRALVICAITLIATMMVVAVMDPAFAGRASAPGQDKVVLCHIDPDNGEFETITIPLKAALKHLENHPRDQLGRC